MTVAWRLRLAVPALPALLALGLAGCASNPGGDGPVVIRTANNTIWATPEAMAAAAAAPASRPAAAAGSSRSSPPAPAPAPAVGSVATAQAAAEPVRSPSDPESLAALARVVYFDFDRADVKDEFRSLVVGHARRLVLSPQRQMVVEGHTDARGSAEYNLALGQRRAESVLRAMVLLGAGQNQLEAVSFGKSRPAVEGHDEAAWSQNRRAELKDR
jgi:peptidoglycan-associated lipoprotein